MQIVALPYADLVLISTNAITAIVFNTFLSIKFLGEQFVWRYDVPALTLMALGGVVIVLCANTNDDQLSPDEIKALITSLLSIVSSGIFCAISIFSLIYIKLFLQ